MTQNIHLIGTGFAGLVHAFALSQKNRIQWYGPAPKPSPHNKQFLLSPYSLRLLQSIKHFDVESSPIRTVNLSHDQNTNFLKFSAEDMGEDALSLSIKEHDLFKALLDNINFDNIVRHEEIFEVSNIQTTDTYFFADGVYSPSAKHFKIPAKQIHNLKITQFHCSSEQDFSHQAWMKFTSRGVWAAVSINQKQLRLIYSSKPFDDYTPSLDEAKVIWESILGPIELHQNPVSFPLKTQLNSRALQDQCLWLGDSAVSLPPVGAQGLNLICRGAYILNQLVEKHPIDQALKHYQNLRQPVHEQKYNELMTLIHGGYWMGKLPTCMASFLMRAGNSSLWLKKHLITQGWGINEPLPTL